MTEPFDIEALKSEIADAVVARLRTESDRDRQWHTVDSLAAKLRISPRTVRDMLASKALPSVKVGGRRLIDPAAVDEYLEGRKAVAGDA